MVTRLSLSWNDGYGAASNIEAVQQTRGRIAAIQGDSGGTVFTVSGSGVLAAGMIQAVAGNLLTGTACGSVNDAGTNKCSTAMYFTSTRTIIRSLGASLAT